MSNYSYQIILLDGDGTSSANIDILKKTLCNRLIDLGLNPDSEIKFLSDLTFDIDFEQKLPAVAVYFGSRLHKNRLKKLTRKIRALSIFILPVVQSLVGYEHQVPQSLKEINGDEISQNDPDMNKIASTLLEQLKLIRQKRLVFISYKRNESRAVAMQLYHSLDERSFEVFLDTHSINKGDPFQPMLWDRMGDSDLIIFLDTENSLTSPWVEKEIAKAHLQALGILQVVWPHKIRSPVAGLCEVEYLTEIDFEDRLRNEYSHLKQQTLEKIVARAEIVRARSFAARRRRIVDELTKAGPKINSKILIQPSGLIQVDHPKRGLINIFPIVGHPDSQQIHKAFDDSQKHGVKINKNYIAYDAIGIWREKLHHLSWLNNYLPVQTIQTTDLIRKL